MEGLELGDGLLLSRDELRGTERTLEGVEDREAVGREEGVEGRAADAERVRGDEGLEKDETEAELVLRIGEDLYEE